MLFKMDISLWLLNYFAYAFKQACFSFSTTFVFKMMCLFEYNLNITFLCILIRVCKCPSQEFLSLTLVVSLFYVLIFVLCIACVAHVVFTYQVLTDSLLVFSDKEPCWLLCKNGFLSSWFICFPHIALPWIGGHCGSSMT